MTGGDLLPIMVDHFLDRVPRYKDTLARNALLQQVLAAPVRIRHEDGAAVVDHPTIDFLGNPVVVTPVPCFHVVDGNAEAPGDDRGHSAVGVPKDQQSFRPMLKKKLLAFLEDPPDLRGKRPRFHAHVLVRIADTQLVEEDPVQPVVVILPSVHQDMDCVLVEQRDDSAQPDNLGPRSEDRHHLHRSSSFSNVSTSSNINWRSWSNFLVPSRPSTVSLELYSLVRQPVLLRSPLTSGSIGRIAYHLPRSMVR